MVSRDHLVEAKLIKELPLISVLPPHHRRPSCCLPSRNHCSFGSSSPFSTASAMNGLTRCNKKITRSLHQRRLRVWRNIELQRRFEVEQKIPTAACAAPSF